MPSNPVLAGYADALTFTPVSSSNLHSVAYAPDFERLFVRFLDQETGGVSAEWAYDGVSRATYDALTTAASKGVFFARTIKPVCAARRVR